MSPRTPARHAARPDHVARTARPGSHGPLRRVVASGAAATVALGLLTGVASATVQDGPAQAGPVAVLGVPGAASEAEAGGDAVAQPLIAEAALERAAAEAAEAAAAVQAAAQAAAEAAAAQAAADAAAAAAAAASPAARVMDVAAQGNGVRYVYGGSTPRGWDCSGYTGWVFRQLGVSLPRTAAAQRSVAAKIPRGEARPGDLVFWGGHHVAIYAGGGMIWHAPRPGKKTGKYPLYGSYAFGRVL
jgi:cell wall-associated NlpC family hydrolase